MNYVRQQKTIENDLARLKKEADAAMREKKAAMREKDAAVQREEAAMREKDAAVQREEVALREKEQLLALLKESGIDPNAFQK
ncbi:hypothetical protein WDW89_03920 [Deltaproteobacteria bacterium TL4]